MKKKNDRVTCVLLLVKSRDKFGRPKDVVVGYDDSTFDLHGGEEFMTAYVNPEIVAKVHS